MRRFGLGALAALALAVGTVRAQDEQAAVREILDRATKALGGTDKTAKFSDVTCKAKARVSEDGNDISFSADLSLQGFERMRIDMTVLAGGQNNSVLMVLNGDKAWGKSPNQDKGQEAPKGVAPLLQHLMMAMRAGNHPTALAAAKGFTLAPGGEAKINDTTATILRLSRKDFAEITLYYDKKSGLPLKSETRAKQPDGDQEKSFEFYFSDFKDVGGAKHFGRVKIVSEGKDVTEVEFTEIKAGEKFEASTFEKP